MTDYSSWKVTDLKAELKRRGIPQTGLRVKQQIIDRLVEEDSKGLGESGNEASAAAEQQTEESQTVELEEPPTAATAENEPAQDASQNDEPEALPEPKIADEKPAENTSQIPVVQDEATDHPAQSPPRTPREETQEVQDKDTDTRAEAKASEVESVQPVEQAPGDVAQPETSVAEADVVVETAEKAALSGVQTSGINTAISTPLPAEEVIEDVKKRKRRSQSPAPNLEAVANKRTKVLGEESPQKLLAEVKKPGPDDTSMTDDALITQEVSQPALNAKDVEHSHESSKSHKQDMRFKGLFTATGSEKTRPASRPADTETEEAEVKPALHAATAALYIDGLMRPLQPAALKNHLLSVATAPGTSQNPESIVEFYLDTIKTHCFVQFVDISTASRARNALHDTVWPNERNRKTLFVDFIPEHKVQDWIQREEQARGRSGIPPRWEVKYDRTDQGVEAVLEEVHHKNAGNQARRDSAQKEFAHLPPRGPRAEMQNQDRRPSGPTQPSRGSQPGQGFKPLDELFKSTAAKPKLYYLPVSRDIADRRLDKFDDLLRKGSYPRRGGDETRRITFEEGDQFVDIGPEFAGRGRGGGRGRGRGGGMASSRSDGRRDRY
ncbi:hypothetical protein BJX63DRAFT_415664 [Aspergillus granulosus]|uniref:SAP domain-containing protein n=1 Tax=Aspergillus granulosus TaxID=176169 RepID=A0ABR4GT24_9EURO